MKAEVSLRGFNTTKCIAKTCSVKTRDTPTCSFVSKSYRLVTDAAISKSHMRDKNYKFPGLGYLRLKTASYVH